MATLYSVAAEAQHDLFEIWRRIAGDSVELAERIHGEFHELFTSLGRMPSQGTLEQISLSDEFCSSRCIHS